VSPDDLTERPRYRFGADVSATFGRLFGESEVIVVGYDTGTEDVRLSRLFFYVTLGVYVTERLAVYGSYVTTEDESTVIVTPGIVPQPQDIGDDLFVRLPMVGGSYTIGDRLTLKAQYAYVNVRVEYLEGRIVERHHFVALAASVLF